jgi:hypothetical protein
MDKVVESRDIEKWRNFLSKIEKFIYRICRQETSGNLDLHICQDILRYCDNKDTAATLQ